MQLDFEKRGLVLLAVSSIALGCGGGASSGRATPTATGGDETEDAVICPGWVPHAAPGGTTFALPERVEAREQGNQTSFVSAQAAYLELSEHRYDGLEGGSDRAAIDGVLAGLGDPADAQLEEGWTIQSQGSAELRGRPAAERIIDIQQQIRRRERIVRAGPTMVRIITMSRHDQVEPNADSIRCFEQSIQFAAPPSP